MGKRKRSEENLEKIKKKLEKWNKRLKKNEEETEEAARSYTPTEQIPDQEEDTSAVTTGDDDIDEVSEELLEALGPEGAVSNETGDPIHQQLASRWINIMRGGLTKENRKEILQKYPIPENFPATAPVLNPEIKAIMSEMSIKRDNRFIWKQNLTGKMLTAIGKALSNVMRGNINSKEIVEHLSNAAKIGAEMFYEDTRSRRYFAVASASPVVKDAIKNEKPDDTLFGNKCSEKIKLAQIIQKTSTQIRDKKKNFKSPLQFQQRSSQQYQQRSGPTQFPRTQARTQQRPTIKKQLPQSQHRRRSPPSHKPRYRK